MSLDADVAVIGLGSAGGMAAWRLAERGATVHGYEQFGIAHDLGAAGGESRMFRSTSLRDPRFIPLARDSVAYWRRLESAAGRQLLTLCGELVIGSSSTPTMKHLHELLAEFALPHEVLDAAEMRHRYPEHQMADDEYAVRDFTAGYVRPELAVMSAIERARRCGAQIFDHTAVERVEPAADGVEVATAGGVRRYRRAIVSTGPWAGELLPAYQPLLQVRRLLAAWFLPRDARDFRPDRFPVYLRFLPGSDDAFYGFPTVDGSSVKIGLPSTNTPVAAPEFVSREFTPAELAAYADVVNQYLPSLHPDPVRTGAYSEAYSSDGQGLVGPIPGAEGVIALCGFSGHGFKYVPLFGEIAADLALDGGTSHEVDFLRPDRALAPWEPTAGRQA
jgi:sarcosine oxidase